MDHGPGACQQQAAARASPFGTPLSLGHGFPLKKAIEQERDQKALDADISDAAAAAAAA